MEDDTCSIKIKKAENVHVGDECDEVEVEVIFSDPCVSVTAAAEQFGKDYN